MTNEEALRLHDRAARGEALSDEERGQLEAWYAVQDAAEARELVSTGAAPVDLADQVHASLEQIAATTRQIQQTMKDNDALRGEIARLRLELAQQSARSA